MTAPRWIPSMLLRHLGLPDPEPIPFAPPDPTPRFGKDLVREFAAYHAAHGSWNGLVFNGMGSEPMDAEGARLAGILERMGQDARWKLQNHARRKAGDMTAVGVVR